MEGAVHQDLPLFDPKGYEDHVVGFLTEHLLVPSGAAPGAGGLELRGEASPLLCRRVCADSGATHAIDSVVARAAFTWMGPRPIVGDGSARFQLRWAF